MRKADNLPPFCAVVTKSGKLNFLEPSGPVQACNGTDLSLPFTLHVRVKVKGKFAPDQATTVQRGSRFITLLFLLPQR